MTFTFKKNKPEGRYRSFFPTTTDVKLKGKIVGMIAEDRDGAGEWAIRLIAKDESKVAGWKWIHLKVRFDTEPNARLWLVNCFKIIQEKFELVGI